MRWPHRFDVVGAEGQEVYLTRWTLVSLFGWKLRLHLFRRPDRDACLHDHPWRFWTLILWGGYVEEAANGFNPLSPGRLAYRPATYRHRVVDLPRGRAWTLVLTAPEEREWGFWSRLGHFCPWRPFVNSEFEERLAWCEDGEVQS